MPTAHGGGVQRWCSLSGCLGRHCFPIIFCSWTAWKVQNVTAQSLWAKHISPSTMLSEDLGRLSLPAGASKQWVYRWSNLAPAQSQPFYIWPNLWDPQITGPRHWLFHRWHINRSYLALCHPSGPIQTPNYGQYNNQLRHLHTYGLMFFLMTICGGLNEKSPVGNIFEHLVSS